MVFSSVAPIEPTLRTVRVEFSLLLLITLPPQRASFAGAGVCCANSALASGKVSTNANSRMSCFFSMLFSLSVDHREYVPRGKNTRPKDRKVQAGRKLSLLGLPIQRLRCTPRRGCPCQNGIPLRGI